MTATQFIMYINRVKTSAYHKLNDDRMYVYANNLVVRGKDRIFDPYRATLEALELVTIEYGDKLQKAKNKGIVEGREKNTAKVELVKNMDIYARVIDLAAETIPNIIPMSGFDNQTRVVRTKSTKLGKAAPYALTFVDGVLSCQCDGAKKSTPFIIEVQLDDASPFVMVDVMLGLSGTPLNLPKTGDYSLRIAAVIETGVFSDYSNVMVVNN